jgi:hypothetical protein
MKKIHYALSLCLLFSSFQAMAQYVIKEADKQYEVFKYAEAIGLYEQAYNKKATLHAAERLGDCYRLNNMPGHYRIIPSMRKQRHNTKNT